jgi:hypothetical protein
VVVVRFVGGFPVSISVRSEHLLTDVVWLADAAEESFGIGESVIENSDGSIGSEPRS